MLKDDHNLEHFSLQDNIKDRGFSLELQTINLKTMECKCSLFEITIEE